MTLQTGHPPSSPSIPTTPRSRRDQELVSFVGRHGAVSIEQVMAASRIGQTAAYRRVAALVDAGLLERLDLLRAEPTLLRATRQGLRYAGLGMAPAIVSPGSIAHWLRCTSTAIDLEATHGPHRILTVRELIAAERHEERPIASAVIGWLPDGRPRLHRPDLVILPEGHPLMRLHTAGGGPYSCLPDVPPSLAALPRTRELGSEISADHGRPPAGAEEMGVVAIEVELTPKSPARLREIIRGWRRAEHVDRVHYLCEPGQTRRAVSRAVEKLHARERISVGEAPPR